jgi:hypothetical protein
MKKCALLMMGIVLIGCAGTAPVFDSSWNHQEISRYINGCIHDQDYHGFIEDLGEPNTVEKNGEEMTAVWVKENGSSKYMLRFIFDEQTLRSNTWSYVEM